MSRPILLAIDDDISVLEAVVQDLRRQYGATYRVLRAGSGQAAIDTLTQLKTREEDVALLLSDQRMPGMTGVEFLESAWKIYPEAKRVLLTAYADTEAAIRAINSARIHYYLTKPWDPPEEKLYPVLDDLLADWNAGYQPKFEGLRVIGHRWSLKDHQLRSFLSRNHVPYRWLDAAASEDAQALLKERSLDPEALPVVLFSDGSALVDPEQEALAARVGLRTQAAQDFYDIIVVGAGPAGLAAAVYGASEGLKTLVIEPEAPGGQAGSSSRIENYLGFPTGITGADLGRRAHMQGIRFGAEFLTQRAVGLRVDGQYRFVVLADGREVSSHVLLLAMGVSYKRLEIPGAADLTGRGIYYGAALVEAAACKDEDVFIVGGANSAGQAALYFARFACKVTMLVRSSSLEASMSKYLIDEIERTSNIVVEPNTQVVSAEGKDHLESLKTRSPEGEQSREAASLFVFIGAEPGTEWLPETILRDEKGFVLSGPDLSTSDLLAPDQKGLDPKGSGPKELGQKEQSKFAHLWKEKRPPFLLETSVPGVFAAGDVRHGSIKRAASAVGEGSIAVQFAHQYLASF
jgi:thioredoxin reductase (NADPH)